MANSITARTVSEMSVETKNLRVARANARPLVILVADACVQPLAVVVKSRNALVARTAVFRTRAHSPPAHVAVVPLFQLGVTAATSHSHACS